MILNFWCYLCYRRPNMWTIWMWIVIIDYINGNAFALCLVPSYWINFNGKTQHYDVCAMEERLHLPASWFVNYDIPTEIVFYVKQKLLLITLVFQLTYLAILQFARSCYLNTGHTPPNLSSSMHKILQLIGSSVRNLDGGMFSYHCSSFGHIS